MSSPVGQYTMGPGDGTLSVRTGRTGAAAKAGHDLVFHVTAWEATLKLGDDASLVLTADAGSLRVQQGNGGIQALGDDDKANIEKTIDSDVLKQRAIEYRSSAVHVADDGRLAVEGELTLADTSRPLAFALAVTDHGALTGAAVITQTEWGMKPYSTLFGALKVADEVTVEIDARLPQSR